MTIERILEILKIEDDWERSLAFRALGQIDLRDADLSGMNLEGANLRWADLRGANLEDAVLCHARLRFADLRGANLYGVDFHDADLRNVKYDNFSQWVHCRRLNWADWLPSPRHFMDAVIEMGYKR